MVKHFTILVLKMKKLQFPQKKMMMKNSNQFRNSYNSVGGVASMVPGQNENVRNSVSSNKIVSN